MAQSVCEMRDADAVPLLEEAKKMFRDGDFLSFANFIGSSMGPGAQALVAPLDRLATLVPDGFESCQVVLQRRDIGGLVQEVSTFNVPDKDFPVSLYLLAMPVRGEMVIGQINFNTAIGPVLENLH